ncbi:MAG TPA: BMP family ABC transporter substrate-binding protein [Candidatus Acidoferrales bacterium]|nr:BMP family ABC transporter substrate-binding protein [Candidatus Acidoferrales bacterium]
MKQRALAALLACVVSMCSLAACTTHRGPKPGQLTLGMVTDVGGLGDRSFNDSAYRGLLHAKSNLDAYVQVLQSRSAADYQPNLIALTNLHFDMIYAIGFLMSLDLDQVAKQNPTQRYAIIDAVVDDPNVVSITFREQDGSFLAGALAAMVSKAHHIAFLGGQDIPLIRKFEAGYIAGAREVDPSIRVDVKYVGNFDDVAAGEELSDVLFNGGADIVYAAAGKCGLGTADAVKSRAGDYMIGVDSDQDALVPGKILTSMVKKVDVAVYDVAEALRDGKPMHGHVIFGLKDGAIGLTDFRYTRSAIGSANLRRLHAIETAIVDGRITPPDTREALAAFKPVPLSP